MEIITTSLNEPKTFVNQIIGFFFLVLVSVLTLRINQPFSILLPFLFDDTIKKIDYTNSWNISHN